MQRRQSLPLSAALVKIRVCDINLDVEMETGTNAYLYLESIEVSTSAPVARVEPGGATLVLSPAP